MTDIGKVYGSALFQLAREEGIDGEIGSQLGQLCEAFGSDYDFVRLMAAPTLKKSKRLEILSECFEGKVHEYLVSFMSILVENNTFEELFSCREEYVKLYNDAHGIVVVTAFTAVPLDGEMRDKLRLKLEKQMGKTVQLKCAVDPSCIGGVRLEMEGERIDGSVRSRLDAIRASLFTAKA